MPIIDVIFLFIVLAFILFGFWFGFIHTLGSTVGFFGGIYIASRLFDNFGGSIGWKIFLFILIYVIVGRLIGLIFYFVNKAFNIVKIVPFTSLLNRLLGAFFGLIEGVLVVTGVVFIIHFYQLESWLAAVERSDFVPYALKLSKILLPFVTNALRSIGEIL